MLIDNDAEMVRLRGQYECEIRYEIIIKAQARPEERQTTTNVTASSPAQSVRHTMSFLTDESINRVSDTHAVDNVGYDLQQFLLEKWELPGSHFVACGALLCQSLH